MKNVILRWCIAVLLLFCISGVMQAEAENVSLSWDPPTTYTDGSPLTVAGYRLYWGISPGQYDTGQDVFNVTTFTVDGLISGGTYYFAVTAYDLFQNESKKSNELAHTVPTAVDTIAPGAPLGAREVH